MSDAISADQADEQARKQDIAKKEAEYAKSLLDQPQDLMKRQIGLYLTSQTLLKQALRDLQDLKGAISEQEYYQGEPI